MQLGDLGELGLLAPDNRRTQTLECAETGEVLTVTYRDIMQLYFQNPTFGLYLLQLTTGRLFQNIARLETELESERKRNQTLQLSVADAASAPKPAARSTVMRGDAAISAALRSVAVKIPRLSR